MYIRQQQQQQKLISPSPSGFTVHFRVFFKVFFYFFFRPAGLLHGAGSHADCNHERQEREEVIVEMFP